MLFDSAWLARAEAGAPRESWVSELLAGPEVDRTRYLETLRRWFESFPRPAAEKAKLARELESFDKAAHLGGVNELCWWEEMKALRWKAEPVPEGGEKRPDFRVSEPAPFYVEVTTLNMPAGWAERDPFDWQRRAAELGLRAKSALDLDRSELVHRMIGKLNSPEKAGQIAYAADRGLPIVPVVFDYTQWSGSGVPVHHAVGEILLDGDRFRELPTSLSGIALMRKVVRSGTPLILPDESVLILNPYTPPGLAVPSFPFGRYRLLARSRDAATVGRPDAATRPLR